MFVCILLKRHFFVYMTSWMEILCLDVLLFNVAPAGSLVVKLLESFVGLLANKGIWGPLDLKSRSHWNIKFTLETTINRHLCHVHKCFRRILKKLKWFTSIIQAAFKHTILWCRSSNATNILFLCSIWCVDFSSFYHFLTVPSAILFPLMV